MTENILTAMRAVMEAVPYVQKEKKGGVQYSIKSEEAIMAAIRPAMVENNVVMYPTKINKLEHSTFQTSKGGTWNRIVGAFTYRFSHAPSDTHIDVVTLGEGADSGDKSANKAMTSSKKYALLEAFLLITGDDPDYAQSPEQTTVSDRPYDRPYPPTALVAMIQKMADLFVKNPGEPLTVAQKQDVANAMTELFGEENSKTLVREFFNAESKDLNDAHWKSVSKWIENKELASTEANNLIQGK